MAFHGLLLEKEAIPSIMSPWRSRFALNFLARLESESFATSVPFERKAAS